MQNEVDRREFIRGAAATGIAFAAGLHPKQATASQGQSSPESKGSQAHDLNLPQMDTVRVALIGVGARGSGHVGDLLRLDGVEIKAICDTDQSYANRAVARCRTAGRPEPDVYSKSASDYRRMLERDDIDVVVISTPWEWHVPMCVDTMNAGKHALVEVPAALTVEGCWELVDAAESNQRYCMMLENVCYGREELLVLNMCRQGVFGELLHGEAAYIHDLRWQMHEIVRGTGSWRTLQYTMRNGNLYPTHGLGPICQYMNINRGDRLDFMSSVSSPSMARAEYAAENFPHDSIRRKHKFVCGDINTSIARTVNGKTMMIQWDEQLPRPYTRHNLIQGTKGVWGGFPNRIVVEGDSRSTERWEQGADLNRWFERYEHPLWTKIGEEARRVGGHGGMDFVMWWRLIYCLRNGIALDQDVYDAAVWSVVTPLSEWSVANRGQSIDFPDFTRGKWKTMKPLEIQV